MRARDLLDSTDIALAVAPTLVLPFGLLIHIGYSFCG
jgi:hypothetical protein